METIENFKSIKESKKIQTTKHESHSEKIRSLSENMMFPFGEGHEIYTIKLLKSSCISVTTVENFSSSGWNCKHKMT